MYNQQPYLNYQYPQMYKQAGIMDSLSGAMPMVGGALAGAGAGAGLGSFLKGPVAKPIASIIGAAMGAYAASKVDSAIDQNEAMANANAMGVDMNGQLGIQNALMNLDQQQALGMGVPQMAPGMGMGQGVGMPPMGMGPGMGYGIGAQQQQQQQQQLQAPVAGQDAMAQMQKKSSINDINLAARAIVHAYLG